MSNSSLISRLHIVADFLDRNDFGECGAVAREATIAISAMEWQDISTAKCGVSLLVCDDEEVASAFKSEDGMWFCDNLSPGKFKNPAHWMPLPEPPEDE